MKITYSLQVESDESSSKEISKIIGKESSVPEHLHWTTSILQKESDSPTNYVEEFLEFRLFWLCADKANLYHAITGFQPLIKQDFVASYTVPTTDAGEPNFLKVNMKFLINMELKIQTFLFGSITSMISSVT